MDLRRSDRSLRTPQRVTSAAVGVDTRLLGKPGEFSGAQEAWRDWECRVQGIRWRSGATIAEADGRGHESGGTDPERYDPAGRRSGSIGAALNIVFLAGDSEGLEAWRLLTEKCEPKMRTRFAGQLMSIQPGNVR